MSSSTFNLFSSARFLIDTSVLLSIVDVSRAHHSAAVNALIRLKQEGALLHIAPQNLVELWAVATRPIEANGLGLTAGEASGLLLRFQIAFTLLPDVPEIFAHWERIVLAYNVSGKPTHDARLVAFMGAHRLSYLLTFNDKDFRRFEGTTPQREGITVLNPATNLAKGAAET